MAAINPYNSPDNFGYGMERKYPNPFFDLASNHIPTDIKSLFRYCRTFFYTDAFLSNVVRKLTEYPITELLYDADLDIETKESWDQLLHEQLKVKSFLIEMGLDYFTYGNSFISVVITQTRFFKHPTSGELRAFKDTQFKFKNFQFYPIIDGRESDVPWTIEDVKTKSVKNFKLVRWNPENIDIEYNPITGSATYFYKIPNEIKAKIKMGDRGLLQDIPEIFIEAVQKNKALQLDPNSFFHFKRPGLAEQEMAWGKPLILPALKKIYYLQTLQRGNEAIAHEHIVPKKLISPAATGAVDPFTSMNMSKWTGEVESQLRKWRKDPNYIAVMPIPMQYQELGGNARALLLTQEMQFLEEVIINSLGVPTEFIKGGASWTGSSISLRIVENMFMGYRASLTDFLNQFLIPRLAQHRGINKTRVKFKKFKMSDDAQAKQLSLQLSQMGKISDQRLLDDFGYFAEEEFSLIARDKSRELEFEKEQARQRAVAQGEGQIILAKYQVRSEDEALKEQTRVKILTLKSELNGELGGDEADYLTKVETFAMQILYSQQEDERMKLMLKLSQKTPVFFSLVMERVEKLTQGYSITSQAEDPRNPTPNQGEVGARQKDKVKVTPEKTRGNTRGQPND